MPIRFFAITKVNKSTVVLTGGQDINSLDSLSEAHAQDTITGEWKRLPSLNWKR